MLQASLGYFINPLLSVVLGFFFLGERLRKWQLVGVAIAAMGVLIQTVATGELPLIALLLAATFGAYGLVRKVVRVEALVGLSIETLLLAPVCLGYICWRVGHGESSFTAQDIPTDLLLIAGGLVTALPLLWFTCAARRLRLVTVGFLQYLAPTGQFLIAAFVFDEAITSGRLVSFVFIWIALVIYSVDAWRASREALRSRLKTTANAPLK